MNNRGQFIPGKGRKIYNPTEWDFPVGPEFTDLAERPDLTPILKSRFPNLYPRRVAIVDGNIIIQDCTPNLDVQETNKINDAIRKLLNSDSLATFQVVDGRKATQDLVKALSRRKLDKTLILYPGNGALSVRNYIAQVKPDFPEGVPIPVQRVKIGKGDFKVNVDLPKNLPYDYDFSDILIVDDVVATGQTAMAIVYALARRIGIMPKLYLASWLVLDNRDPYYPNRLSNFQSVYASLAVRGSIFPNPPINSLSCLLDETGRYDWVKQDYAAKYIKNPEILKTLKKIVKGE